LLSKTKHFVANLSFGFANEEGRSIFPLKQAVEEFVSNYPNLKFKEMRHHVNGLHIEFDIALTGESENNIETSKRVFRLVSWINELAWTKGVSFTAVWYKISDVTETISASTQSIHEENGDSN